jgi:hypothetical protein
MARYIISCDVKLEGATMYVEADSPEEARAKAARNEWDDIDYKGAALVDWEPHFEGMKEDR